MHSRVEYLFFCKWKEGELAVRIRVIWAHNQSYSSKFLIYDYIDYCMYDKIKKTRLKQCVQNRPLSETVESVESGSDDRSRES